MSVNNENPYATPNSDVNNGLQSRSLIPKIIGIISLIFAVLGLIGSIAGLTASFFMPQMIEAQIAMGFDKDYLLVMNMVSLITSLWAFYIGIKLIKYKDVGRRHFNYYTILTIIISIINFFYTKDIMKNLYLKTESDVTSTVDMSTISSLSVFIEPILMIIVALLLNKSRVKADLN